MDLAFADVVSSSSDQRLGQIRLAWWRERLEELDQGKPMVAEPRLQAVASELVPRGVTGTELSQLEDAWLPLLEPFPWSNAQAEALKLRGQLLFGIGGRLLEDASPTAIAAGELWSLIDGAQHCSDPDARRFLLEQAASMRIPAKAARRVRPLTVLAVLAVSDMLKPSSAAIRGFAAIYHRMTGRFAGS